ncbi:MAG: hypothetical protein ACM3VT_00020, partial [Solirubrobacterales bacterium]
MSGQSRRIRGPRRRARLVGWVLASLAMVCLPIASGGQPSSETDAVRVRRVPWVGYVSVVVENHRAYDVTATLAIRGRNVQITQIAAQTGSFAGHSQT